MVILVSNFLAWLTEKITTKDQHRERDEAAQELATSLENQTENKKLVDKAQHVTFNLREHEKQNNFAARIAMRLHGRDC